MKYNGYMVFCISETGDIVVIRSEFRILDASPWMYKAMLKFVEENAKKEGIIYMFKGFVRNYKFHGKTWKLDV